MGVIKSQTFQAIFLCTKLLQVHFNNYALFMEVNKDFKNCKTNRPELNDLRQCFQNDILFQKMQMFFWIVMRPRKTQSLNLKS